MAVELKIQELFSFFLSFPQLCLHKSRLSSDITGAPTALGKKRKKAIDVVK